MSLELRQLRALVAVVDEGTFTDAGIALGISQASVSRSVAALEKALGARILKRTTRDVTLTPLGVRIIDSARRALTEAADIERAAHDAPRELRVGYAWSALGRHTTTVQRRWASEHAGSSLVFVQSNTATAGLSEGLADVAVLRRELNDRRYMSVQVGAEERYAAVASGDPLARRRGLVLADFADRTIAIDGRTGTTTEDLWAANALPSATRTVHGVDEWLTVIAAGQAVGITSEATARQHPRPGVAFRPVRGVPPVPVWLAWRRDNEPTVSSELRQLVIDAYGEMTRPKP